MIKDELRPSLFWDVDFDALDVDQYAAFVTLRVIEHGTREEVRSVWTFYGKEKVRQFLLNARSLNPKTISYFSNIFQLNPSAFRSYNIQKDDKTWP